MTGKRIVVLGATGMIGSAVTRQLVVAGHSITAVVRQGDGAAARVLSGLEVVQGDAALPDTLRQPLEGADAVFFALSVDPKRGRPEAFNPDRDGLTNLLGVLSGRPDVRVLYLASLLQDHNPHDWWVLAHKREAVERLETSGVRHTIFKPSNFMENLPNRNLRGRSVALIGKPRYRNWWIAADDFGKQVAAHVGRPSPSEADRTFAIQGPEALDYEEAARRFASAYTREPLKVSFAPVPVFKLLGRFVPEMKYALEISRASNDSPESFEAQATWDELGRPETTIERFAVQASG